MYIFKIIKNGLITHQAKFASQLEGQAWIDSQEAVKAFGEVDKYLTALEAQDLNLSIEDKVSTQIEEDGKSYLKYLFPKEYEIQIEDISAMEDQKKINKEALEYLNSTDWYVIRKSETGVDIPMEVLLARAEARLKIVK